MLYKYHLAIIKDENLVCDKYYQEGQKPDNDELKSIIEQYEADELYLNTVEDNELESFSKEKIDIDLL